jgi:hypothetical protein
LVEVLRRVDHGGRGLSAHKRLKSDHEKYAGVEERAELARTVEDIIVAGSLSLAVSRHLVEALKWGSETQVRRLIDDMSTGRPIVWCALQQTCKKLLAISDSVVVETRAAHVPVAVLSMAFLDDSERERPFTNSDYFIWIIVSSTTL